MAKANQPFIRIPLHTEITIDDLDSLAWRENWDLQNVIVATDQNPYEAIWHDAAGNAVHYFDDQLLDLGYVAIRGPGAEALERMVRDKLAAVSDDEIISLDREAIDSEDRISAAYLAGVRIGAIGGDEMLALLKRALADEDPEVRRAAVLAAGYAERVELQESLAQLSGGDPDPVVRREAEEMLTALEAEWRKKSGSTPSAL